MTPPTSPPSLEAGQSVGRFELLREVGRGPLGVLFEARDTELRRGVTFRLIRPGPGGPVDWREAEALASLAHPNLVTLFDVGRCPQGPYLVLELLRGRSLAERLAGGTMAPSEAISIAVQVARALAYAHGRGVVHHDLNPTNVFLTDEGPVKVLDFGLAHAFGRRRLDGGPLEFAAPEQQRGAPEDSRVDVYALGALLHRMLGGARIAAAAPEAAGPVEVPGRPGLRELVDRLRADDPAARPPDGRAALAALEPYWDGGGSSTRKGPPSVRIRRPVAWGRRLGLAAALVGIVVAAFLVARLAAPTGPTVPSVAVLPFADLSPGQDQDYFSDGLSEEILNALAQARGLHVAGRTSSFSFKGKQQDLGAVGRQLGVEAILQGTVRRDGRRIRVSAELARAGDGAQLWSQTFDRELTGVFAVQDEIASAVVAALKVKLLAGGPPTSREVRIASPQAHDLYLLGLRLASGDTVQSARRAADAFEKVIAIDPTYAPAWAHLSNAILWGWASEGGSPQEIRANQLRALAAAERAVALDPESGLGYEARGFLRATVEHDWAGARADLEHALATNPGTAGYHLIYGRFVLGPLGQFTEAVAATRRATELDPLNAAAWTALSGALLAAGDTAGARAAALRSLELSPKQDTAPVCLATALLLEGKPVEAIAAARRSVERLYVQQIEAAALHDLGQPRASQEALDALVAAHATDAPFQIAAVHAWRGESEKALTWLEEAEALHDGGLTDLQMEPLLRSVRDAPRYRALLRRLKLTAP